jgi:tetratricopeptide (TPR) repeat protein
MRFLRYLLLLAGACTFQLGAETPIEAGYAALYNLDFASAHADFEGWSREHPDDPLAPASDAAAYLFSEFDRLHILQSEFFTHDQHFITDHRLSPDPALKKQLDAALATTEQLARRSPADPDSMFAVVLAHGLRSDYQALIEKRYAASFGEMKAGRELAEKLLAADPHYTDAWVAVGVENYMLSVRPAVVRWLCRLAGGETDRATGVARLKLTAEKGHYLAPFARLLLAVAALRDHNPRQARSLLEGLAHEYPRNRLYRLELARMENGDVAR